MLQERWQRHAERFCQFTYGSGPAAEPFQYRPPGRVGQSVEHSIQLKGLLVRHVPYYTGKPYLGQYISVWAVGSTTEICDGILRRRVTSTQDATA